MPERSNRNKYLGIVTAGALLSSLCFVMLIDLAQNRILIAADVERTIGFPALGLVLQRNAQTRHFAEEHFVRLVNKMELIYRQSGARILVFTPIKPERGPNATVPRLGQALQARGIRTTVVDANTFGLERLDSESPIDSEPAGTLAMRTIGTGTSGARKRPELLSAGIQPPSHSTSRFSAALAQLLEDYEVILVEAPPLLFSADAEYLATISGATFLTVEAGQVTKGELKRAASLMEKLQPRGIGVILDRVSLKAPDFELRRRFREYEACRARTKTA